MIQYVSKYFPFKDHFEIAIETTEQIPSYAYFTFSILVWICLPHLFLEVLYSMSFKRVNNGRLVAFTSHEARFTFFKSGQQNPKIILYDKNILKQYIKFRNSLQINSE